MAKGGTTGKGGVGASRESLSMTQQMSTLMLQMSISSEKISKSFESQVSATAEMSKNMKNMGTGEVVVQLVQVNETLKKVAAALSNLSENASAAFAGLAAGATDAAGATNKFADAASKAAEAASKGKTSLNELQDKLGQTGKNALSGKQKIAALGSYLEKEFPVASGAALGALSGLKQGFDNLVSLGSGILGFASSIGSAMLNIGSSIISIPFKLFDGLINMAKKGGGISELATALNNIRKEFGSLKGPVASSIQSTAKQMNGLAGSGLSAMQVFGTVAERMELLTTMFAAGGVALQSFSGEFKDNGLAILGFQKGLGITNEQMGSLASTAKASGTTITEQLIDITKQADHLADKFKLDAKIVSKGIVKATTDISHFGSMSKAQIASSVTYFTKLGVEVDKVVGTMDAFSTFDTAAENVSTLNQVFGTSIDAMKLVNAQDPADVIEHLRKEFARAGIDGEKMTRQQRMMVKQMTNMDDAEQKLIFSSKNRNVSLADIRKESEKAEKKTMTQTQAMAKLADSMDRVLKAGESKEGGFFGHFFQGFTDGIQKTTEFQGLMKNIRGSLMTVWLEGKRLGKGFVDAFPGVKEFLGGLTDIFQPAKFKKLVGGTVDVFIGFFKDLESGKASFPDLMERLKKHFFNFFDSEKGAGQKVMGGFKKIMMAIQVILAGGIKWVMESIGGFIRNIVNFIKNPSDITGGMGDVASAYISPIGQAFRDGWKILGPALGDLFSVLFKKLGDIIMPKVKAFASEYWPILAGILFGPMAFRAMLGAGTAVFSKAIGGMISKAFGGSDTQSLILKEMQGLNKTLGSAAGSAGGAAKAGKVVAGLAKEAPALKAAGDVASAGINWAAIGTFLIGFAGVMAIGLLTFYIAALIVEDMDKETVIKALAVTLAMAIAAVPVAFAMQILSTMPPVAPSVYTVLGSLALAMIGLGVIIVAITAGMSMGDVAGGMLMMIGMSIATIAVAFALSLLTPMATTLVAASGMLYAALGVLALAMIGLAGLGAIIVLVASKFSETEIENGMKLILGMALAAMLVSLSMAAIMAAGAAANPTGMAALAGGFIAIGLAVIGLGALAAFMVNYFANMNLTQVKTAGDIIWEAAKVVGIIALAIGAMMLVGAVMLTGGFFGTAALIAGFLAIGVVLGDKDSGLVCLTLTIVEGVKNMPDNIGEKAKAFAVIMDSIAKIAQVIPDTLEAMDLGFFASHEKQVAKIEAVNEMIKSLLGTRGGNGLIGLIETILTGLQQMTPAQVEVAKAIGPLLQGVAGIAAAFGSVGSSMGEAFKNIDDDDFEKIEPLIEKMGTLIDKIALKIPEVINGILPLIDAVQGKDINIEGVKAIGTLLGAIGPIAMALTPPPGVMATLTEMSKNWGENAGEMMTKLTTYIDKMASSLTGTKGKPGLISVMKDSIIEIIQEMNQINISESSAKALGAIGPIISTMATFVSSMSGNAMEIVMKTSKNRNVKQPDPAVAALDNVINFAGKMLGALSDHVPPLIKGIAEGLKIAASLTPDQIKVLEPVGKLIESILKLVIALMPQPSWPTIPAPGAVAQGGVSVQNVIATFPSITTTLKELADGLPNLINAMVKMVGELKITNPGIFNRNLDIVVKLFEMLPKLTELGKVMGMAEKDAGTLNFSEAQGKKLAFAIDGVAWGIKAITNEEYYHAIGGVGRTPLAFFIEELGPAAKIWGKAAGIDFTKPQTFFDGLKKLADVIKSVGNGGSDLKSAAEAGLSVAAGVESIAMALAYMIDPTWYGLAGGSGRPPVIYLRDLLKNQWPNTSGIETGVLKIDSFFKEIKKIQDVLTKLPSSATNFSESKSKGVEIAAGLDSVAWGIGAMIDEELFNALGGVGRSPLESLVRNLSSNLWNEAGKISQNIPLVQRFLSDVQKIAAGFSGLESKLKISTKNTYGEAARAITNMMAAIVEIDGAVSGTKNINLKKSLDKFKANFGSALGGSGKHVITTKPLVMTINFTVQIDAAKLEGAIIKHGTEIKDKFNLVYEAIGEGPGRYASPPPPESAADPIGESNMSTVPNQTVATPPAQTKAIDTIAKATSNGEKSDGAFPN